MAYTQGFSQSPTVLERIWHAYPAFVIGTTKKIWKTFVPKQRKTYPVDCQVVEVKEETKNLLLLAPTPEQDTLVINLDEFILDYSNYEKDHIIKLLKHANSHKEIKELWLELSAEFEELIDEKNLTLTKTQGYRRNGKYYFRTCKDDYFLALNLLNTHLNNAIYNAN